ncbi:MAG: Mur ligase domain-containing protein, partial [Alphaproteobacteria bacterium]|nr:Mur ligase domain-containing protein [Alphaproteobacteria bacterium]
MRLSKLIAPPAASSDGLALNGPDVDITGITADSRNVKPGFLFAAIPGTKNDGRAFIPEAIKRGAVAVLEPQGTDPSSVTAVTAPDVRKAISLIAAQFYPRQPETIAAVTGTSGKTSTTQFARELWSRLGRRSA